MKAIAQRLRSTLESALPLLEALPDAVAALPLAPGKWSRKELVGHLIDSASNNHQRFVRAQFQDELVFPGYDQDAWTAVQHYRERPWRELLELFRALNLHIAHVIEHTPRERCARLRERHNLHEIAWRTVPRDEPATLGHFHADYVGHLEHHLRQALAGWELGGRV
jgi:hypothetical protein